MGGSREEILGILRQNRGRYLSGGEMSRRLGVSRAAIWKQVEAMRREGYSVRAVPRLGYLLEEEPDRLRPEELGGPGIVCRAVVDSTSSEARRLAEEGYPGGTTVVAEEQTAGRGRRGRSWNSSPGKGLWFSMLLRPEEMSMAGAPAITLAVAVAAARAITAATGVAPGVKWPNDLLAGGRKIAGILTEVKGEPDRVEYLVVGIGVNVNHGAADFPPELRARAGSLRLAAGRVFDRTSLFLSLREGILDACDLFFRQGFAPFRQPWKDSSVTLGRPVKVSWPGGTLEGTALDLDPGGALVVQDPHGRIHRLHFGELE